MCRGLLRAATMRNGKDILSEPVVVRLTLVSLTPSVIVQAEALIRSTDGLAVLEAEGWSDLSQTSRLSAPSSGAVSALGANCGWPMKWVATRRSYSG
jgi:hypothetical protein